MLLEEYNVFVKFGSVYFKIIYIKTKTVVVVTLFQGKIDESLRAFEALVQKFPQSPRCRYGKAQVTHNH